MGQPLGSIDGGLGKWIITSSILKLKIEANGTEVFDLWVRVVCSSILSLNLAALSRRLSRWRCRDHWSSPLGTHHGLASPYLGLNDMATVGSLSVDLTWDKVPTHKSKYHCWCSKQESMQLSRENHRGHWCLNIIRNWHAYREYNQTYTKGSLEMASCLYRRSKAMDSISEAMPGTTMWWTILDSIRPSCNEEWRSREDRYS